MDSISCDFFWKVRFNYLEAKYWTYRSVFNKYVKPGRYLMYLISSDFFSKVYFKYLEVKYWRYC